jgi:hypothetical protein
MYKYIKIKNDILNYKTIIEKMHISFSKEFTYVKERLYQGSDKIYQELRNFTPHQILVGYKIDQYEVEKLLTFMRK